MIQIRTYDFPGYCHFFKFNIVMNFYIVTVEKKPKQKKNIQTPRQTIVNLFT